METYIIHKMDGQVEVVKMSRPATLKWFQAEVGGWIERVKMGDVDIICNEDGYYLNLRGNVCFPGFVGNVVICQDRQGRFCGVPESYLENPYYMPKGGWDACNRKKPASRRSGGESGPVRSLQPKSDLR